MCQSTEPPGFIGRIRGYTISIGRGTIFMKIVSAREISWSKSSPIETRPVVLDKHDKELKKKKKNDCLKNMGFRTFPDGNDNGRRHKKPLRKMNVHLPNALK